MHTSSEDRAALLPSPSIPPSIPQLPRPPSPSADPGITPNIASPSEDSSALPEPDEIDVFTLSSVAALKMLCVTVEALVQITGDVPPTPPTSEPGTPNLGNFKAEKDVVAPQRSESAEIRDDADGVPPNAKTPIGSPEAGPSEPFHIIGSNMEPLNVQRGAITRKFYSKKPPPIALEDYLLRLHRFCPMSTAVYLATSLYIYRLAVIEEILPVTARNVHRLVLAGLRVAMKALEDLSYPHRRFAKVGGISEPELGKLEVSFCFVTNFELKVDRETLLEHAKSIRGGTILYKLPVGLQSSLPHSNAKRDLVVGQSKPAAVMKTNSPTAA